jgi:cyclophilin family peptidyl-prolyl cis-trans isomerase
MSWHLRILMTLIIIAVVVACGQQAAPQPSKSEDRALANVPPAKRENYYKTLPPLTIDTQKTYVATVTTNKGNIVISLDAKAAPQTVNNFVFLANQGFYDGLVFHRVEPGFVIQGGDPAGKGTGGPGYTIPAEIKLPHVEGAIAMARLSDQVNPKRESSGSQFYITLAPTPFLDGQYTAFGKVTQGMDVVKKIAVGDVIQKIVVSGQ